MLITKFKKYKHTILSLVLYHLIIAIVVFTNIPKEGIFLTGWDALHPEFNFQANLGRSLNAVWQTNYGLGSLVGHGFASLLPHVLITWFLSLFLPLSAIRPVFILITYWLGGLGMIFFAKQVIKKFINEKYNNFSDWIGLITGLFYLFNLGTIQQFYLPLEAFVIQFSLLPWLFLTVNKYLENNSKKNLFFIALVLFLGSTQGFIPAIFVSLIITLIVVASTWIVFSKNKINCLKKWLSIALVFTMVNSYWLLPFGYYVIGNNGDFLNSYNNQLSTIEFVAKSQNYGNFQDTVFLKSFFLDGEQPSGKVFQPWLDHNNKITTVVSGWILFSIILIGWMYLLLQKKEKTTKSYSIGGLIIFGFLAIKTPPFSWFMNLFYENSELFSQLFRTNFTKFINIMAFFYSIFFGIGLYSIIINIDKLKKLKLFKYLIIIVSTLIVINYGYPALNGNLFNQQLKVKIPDPYFGVMDYFNKQGEGRIVELPIDCTEGWFARPWGYYGSGFEWFGVKQPYMSRTFDVWNKYNENFYFEIRYALRQPEYKGLDSVLKKYDVRWVYLDNNLEHCQSANGFLHLDNIQNYLDNSDNFNLVGDYSDNSLDNSLMIYEINNTNNSDIYLPSNFIKSNDSSANKIDKIYNNYGDYSNKIEAPSVSYLFNNFDSKDNGVKQNDLSIENINILAKKTVGESGILHIPSYLSKEKVLPVKISIEETNKANSYIIKIEFMGPTIKLNDETLLKPTANQFGPITIKDIDSLELSTNNIEMIKIDNQSFIGTFFSELDNNFIASYDNNSKIIWESKEDSDFQEHVHKYLNIEVKENDNISIEIPKVFDQNSFGNVLYPNRFSSIEDCSLENVNGTNKYELGTSIDDPILKLKSQNDSYCAKIKFDEIRTNSGQIIKISSKYIEGLPLEYRLTNWRGINYIHNYLTKNKEKLEQTFIIPPVFEKDLGYTFEFRNKSLGNQYSVNDIYSIEHWFLPYNLLSSINIKSGLAENNNLSLIEEEKVTSTHYLLTVKGEGLLTITQSFDEGWIAYKINGDTNNIKTYLPWIQGEKLEHTKINGWANGWIVKNNEFSVNNKQSIVIIYWPQYLELFGILITALSIPLLIKRKKQIKPPAPSSPPLQ